MMLIPRQWNSYILTNSFIWVCRLLTSVASLLYIIGSLNMFDNIPDIKIATAITAVAVLAWVFLVQYSKFIDHRKKNKDVDQAKYEAKFAIIPYFAIPVAFSVISVIGGLFVAQYALTQEWIIQPEYVCLTSVVSALVINCILDKYLVSHVGDAVYFQTIEDAVVKSVEDSPKSPKDMTADEKLALLREMKII